MVRSEADEFVRRARAHGLDASAILAAVAHSLSRTT
jgi:hypothetical protein